MLLHGYFDDTGTHEGAVITGMGGYLFTVEGAARFDKEWRQCLEKAGIAFFHAYECWSRSGPFGRFTEADRDAMFGDIARLTAKVAVQGFMTTVKQSEYNEYMAEQRKIEAFIGTPFSLCLMRTMAFVGQWIEMTKFNGEILYLFESGNPKQDEAEAFCKQIWENDVFRERYRMRGYDFRNKRQEIPLQAADMLAWEWQRNFVAFEKDDNAQVDPFFKILTTNRLYRSHVGPVSMGILALVHGFYGVAKPQAAGQ